MRCVTLICEWSNIIKLQVFLLSVLYLDSYFIININLFCSSFGPFYYINVLRGFSFAFPPLIRWRYAADTRYRRVLYIKFSPILHLFWFFFYINFLCFCLVMFHFVAYSLQCFKRFVLTHQNCKLHVFSICNC